MKKTFLLGLAVVGALGFTACNNSNTTANAAQPKGGSDKEVLYSGILPAADAQGTVYTLKLDFDDDNNYTDGDFLMIENSLASDTVSVSGLKEVATSYTEGDFRKESKTVNGETVEYIRLIPEAKDALGTPSASSLYFIVNADGSLTMVGESLEAPVMAEMYTLSVK